MRVACAIALTDEQRRVLQRWARGRSTPVRLMQRAKIVLMAAEGTQNKDIAATLRLDGGLVGRWRRRFADKGLPGIEKDAPRSGRKPTRRAAVAAKILEMTTQHKPADATHWSTRTMAAAVGASRSMVHRVWQDSGLKPHLARADPRERAGLTIAPGHHNLPASVTLLGACGRRIKSPCP